MRGQVSLPRAHPGLYDPPAAKKSGSGRTCGIAVHGREASSSVGLAHVAGERVRGFSAGMQRRLALARLILKSSRVLLLDEPYSNLDAEGVELMNSLIAGVVRSGGAALVALHELAPAKAMLDRTPLARANRSASRARVATVPRFRKWAMAWRDLARARDGKGCPTAPCKGRFNRWRRSA